MRIKSLLPRLVLSISLLLLFITTWQQYQAGLMEHKAKRVYPMLQNGELAATGKTAVSVIKALDSSAAYTSERHWLRGVLLELQEDEALLEQAELAVWQAVEQRPGWPMYWWDLIRIKTWLGMTPGESEALLRRFVRVGKWNRQANQRIAGWLLLHWEDLTDYESSWLLEQAPKSTGAEWWVKYTGALVAQGELPLGVCLVIDTELDILEQCYIDELDEEVP